MPVDSLTLAAALIEASPVLVGARLQTLAQGERGTLSLAGRDEGRNWHWLVDLRDGVARAHLSEAPVGKGAAPPWLMQARKHVEGGRILSVVQTPWERVIHLRLSGRDALGDPHVYRLVLEIMGRYSLAALVDDETGQIMATSRVVDETMSRYRQVEPGLPYALPPKPDKPSLAECDDSRLQALVQEGAAPWDKWLAKTFAGLGKERVQALSADLPADEVEARNALQARLARWRDAWSEGLWRWEADGEPKAWPGDGIPEGLNAALDRYYQQKLQGEGIERLRAQLTAAIEQARGKLDRQLADLDAVLADRGQVERLQQEAELLQANLYRLPEGGEAVDLEDYFQEDYPTVTLSLDPHKTPAENVQERFRQAQKAARRVAHAEQQRDELAAAVAGLEEAAYYVGEATALGTLREVAAGLEGQGVIKQPGEKRRREEGGPERYRSSDGLEILVGRSSRQNETILHEVARGHDLWLHAQYIPGAHVLVRLPKGSQVPDRTLEEAALLAAHFSKARQATNVPVVAVPRRFVRSPKGAPSGFVHYSNETVVVVSPDVAALPGKIATDA